VVCEHLVFKSTFLSGDAEETQQSGTLSTAKRYHLNASEKFRLSFRRSETIEK
jgi:hypothetical protein